MKNAQKSFLMLALCLGSYSYAMHSYHTDPCLRQRLFVQTIINEIYRVGGSCDHAYIQRRTREELRYQGIEISEQEYQLALAAANQKLSKSPNTPTTEETTIQAIVDELYRAGGSIDRELLTKKTRENLQSQGIEISVNEFNAALAKAKTIVIESAS